MNPSAAGDSTTSGKKNIVLCFDGTGDWATKDSTNVLKLFEDLDFSSQVVFYDGGVGTLDNPGQMTRTGRFVSRALDLALATGLRDKVLNGYRFLVENYEPGCRVFLFGFSRGAFTARVLAGMIDQFGLLRPEHVNLAPYLWQTIADFKKRSSLSKSVRTIRDDFCSKDIRIHFLGLFDTVSSVGILTRFKTYPSADRNGSVDIIRHAVAIDESRNCFPESLMERAIPRDGEPEQDLIQVWFPGVHRDVGGGNVPEKSGLSDEPLKWIYQEGAKNGLLFQKGPQISSALPVMEEPGFDFYVFAGLYPMFLPDERLPMRAADDPYDRYRYFWPNLKHIRRMPPGALVHDSVQAFTQTKRYDPPNLPPNPSYWDLQGDLPLPSPSPQKNFERKLAFPDFVGITLGTALIALLCDWILGGWLGQHVDFFQPPVSWAGFVNDAKDHLIYWINCCRIPTPPTPPDSSPPIWLIGVLALLYLILQGWPRKVSSPEGWLPKIGLALVVPAYFVFWQVSPFWVGFLFGAIIWLFCRVLPLAPPMHADRALPTVGLWWLRIAVLGAMVIWLEGAVPIYVQCASPIVGGVSAVFLGLCIRGMIFDRKKRRAFKNRERIPVVDDRGRIVTYRLNRREDRAEYRELLAGIRTRWKWIQADSVVVIIASCLWFMPNEESVRQWAWVALLLATMIPVVHIIQDRLLFARGEALN